MYLSCNDQFWLEEERICEEGRPHSFSRRRTSHGEYRLSSLKSVARLVTEALRRCRLVVVAKIHSSALPCSSWQPKLLYKSFKNIPK